MTRNSKDALEELLRGEVERLSQETLQNSGQVSQPQMDAIANLMKLIEIRKSLNISKSSAFLLRWTAPLLLVTTLAIATLLLFIHVRRTEIELDVRAAEVGLRLASDAVFVEGADLTGLGVS